MAADGELPGPAGDRRSGEPGWRVAARADLAACVERRLHWLVTGLFAVTMASIGLTTGTLSEAFYATGDLAGAIRLVTTNAAWLFTSLVALVGLFVGYPVFEGREGGASRERLRGRLASRWTLVGGGVLAGLLALLAVAAATYESVAAIEFVAFAAATVGLALSYTSLGVAVSVLASSRHRAVGWLLAVYFGLTFLWDTWIVPLGVLLVAAGGSPEALADRPGWFEALVASSPGGAYAALGDAIVAGAPGLAEAHAVASLLAWIVGPPIVAGAVVSRR